jgi:hypothetical protein
MDDIFDIDGRQYKCAPIPPLAAVKLQAKAVSALGSNAMMASGVNQETDESKMIAIITGMLTGVDADKFTEIVKEVCSEIFYAEEGKLSGGLFDQHFSEYQQDLFPVVAWGLYQRISPFFSGAALGFKNLAAAAGLSISRKGTKTAG